MSAENIRVDELRPAGYVAITALLGLRTIPNWHESYIAAGNTHKIESNGGLVKEIYPSKYWPGDSVGDHLEFALKYDGVNPAVLACIFRGVETLEIEAYVASKPSGKYARRIWYLFEQITGRRLSLHDLKGCRYVDLLDQDKNITVNPGKRVSRQCINDNLLGDVRFCPIVRRTEAIENYMAAKLRQRCQDIVADYPQQLFKRALSYLYTKETKSSFEIEHIKPNASRTERFVTLLELAEKENFCQKPRLVSLHNRIVDPRFAVSDYRNSQNYVGETVSWETERIHYASPKPDDLNDLMAGLVESHQRMRDGSVHPVVHAAVVAYGFVFMHPFEDGNGRIHRFLIHNILARKGFTPEGLMFPVSAAMLKNPSEYDASLEAFSKQVMPLVEYELDDVGRMTILNDTRDSYRFIDMTAQVEALFGFIEKTIDTELVEDLNFLVSYDRTKDAIQDVVDMPDRQIDLFIRFCLQNNGQLSARKRASHFDFLTDDEVARMERAVRSAYRKE